MSGERLSQASSRSLQLESLEQERYRDSANSDQLLSKVAAWVRPSYTLIKSHQKKSRFYGWKWGVLTGAIAGALVLTLNLTMIALGFGKGHDAGIATLLFGNKVNIAKANTSLHLLINICSTLLLSASNYAMQVLSAPTRAECDRAHRERKSLDIGVMSFSNIKSVTRKRRWLWIGLAASSVPLHLFYNASVFQIAPMNRYIVSIVEYQSQVWSTMNKTLSDGITKQLTVSELAISSNMEDVMLVTLAIDEAKVAYIELASKKGIKNVTSSLGDMFLQSPNVIRNYTYLAQWPDLTDADGWLRLENQEIKEFDNPLATQNVDLLLHVQGAFVRPKPDWSKISLSLPLILIVTVSNATKLAVFVFILLDVSLDPPLVTMGDVIASFLSNPDPNTATYRNFSRDDFIYLFGNANLRTKIEVEEIKKGEENIPGHWQPRIRRYGLTINRHRTSYNDGLAYIRISALLVAAAASLVLVIPLGPWGTESNQRFQFTNGLAGSGYVLLALLVNTPQLLLSAMYFTFNNICTSIATVHEYNQFGLQPKPLRVSKPKGKQRERYFLQLPLRFAIPLNTAGGVLHWLTSQTLFLIRLDHVHLDGSWDKAASSAAWGVSGSAYLTTIIVLWILLISILIVASTKFTERVPFAGTCSWVVSAACHPPTTDEDPALREVRWGRLINDCESNEISKQFTFASSAIIASHSISTD